MGCKGPLTNDWMAESLYRGPITFINAVDFVLLNSLHNKCERFGSSICDLQRINLSTSKHNIWGEGYER